jgi:hypothetical protein
MTIIYSSKELRPREPNDFYPTPKELIRAIFKDYITKYAPPRTVLDPGCGDGVWGEVAREFFPDAQITGVDIRELPKNSSYTYWVTEDFLTSGIESKYFELIIGNPPFKYAEQFLDKCLPCNKVIFLLQASFLESKKRYLKYYKSGVRPTEVKISTRRISFTGNKKSDNTMYGIFYWMRSNIISDTKVSWLDWEYKK